MRNLPLEILAQLNARQGIVVRNFVWFNARNRSTNVIETIGIWTGEDVQQFAVSGQTRTYYGGGSFIGLSDLKSEKGLYIRSLTANCSPLSPEMAQVLRGYDIKFAAVEVHIGFFSTETNNLVAPLERVFKGWVDKMSIKTPALGGEGSATIDMVSHTRLLTKTLASKRSNETQKQRNVNDTLYVDVAITGTIQTPWGSK